MSSTVCQGLQSCLEPRLVEHRSLVLKLVSPKLNLLQKPEVPTPKEEEEEESNKSEPESPWSSIQSVCRNPEEEEKTNKGDPDSPWSSIQSLCRNPIEAKQSCYIQPLSKRASLSSRSLELCTENLGCETGTDIAQGSSFSLSSFTSSPCMSESVETEKRGERRVRQQTHQASVYKKENHGSFPPPLTSITGQDCTKLRPHREGGRLVLKAFTIPSSQTFFKAERSDGRLRLRLINQISTANSCPQMKEEEQEEVKEEVEDNGDVGEDEEEVDEEAEEEVEREGEGTMGSENNGEDEMGMDKFQRPSRCKESGHRNNKGMLMWEPFWVATS